MPTPEEIRQMPDPHHEKPTILNVSVTQAHIDYGNPGNCRYCPVALAIRELFTEHPDLDIAIGHRSVAIHQPGADPDRWFNIDLPPAAADFDYKPNGIPFSFSLSIPEELAPYLKSKT